jgi:PGF-CTERM protein
MLGTLGHHGQWRYAGQTIDIKPTGGTETQDTPTDGTETQTTPVEGTEMEGISTGGAETEDDDETAGGSGPGFGVVSALTGLGGTGYLLSSRTSGTDDD